ncbi:hypothetical protein CDAR_113561 [Caerostris darwini]|uniref:Uncharacterized protein n=1 Tax=Caerostris darwini TaxID=1538125 RepID=A0AAV4NM60_9ARAC|nr:hypothetical protein CDAR_113561 [Caerostris darwini]
MKYLPVQGTESAGLAISSSPSLVQSDCTINSFVGLVLQTIRVTSLKTRKPNLEASIFGKECTKYKIQYWLLDPKCLPCSILFFENREISRFTRRVLSFNDSDRRPTIKGEGGDNNIEIKQLLIGVGSISFHPRGEERNGCSSCSPNR